MSYSVNLYGTKDFETAAETEAFELDVIQRVTEFAHSLPGLGGGTINTTTQAQAVLQASDGAATTPAGEPVPVVPADALPADVPTDRRVAVSPRRATNVGNSNGPDRRVAVAERRADDAVNPTRIPGGFDPPPFPPAVPPSSPPSGDFSSADPAFLAADLAELSTAELQAELARRQGQ